MSRRQSTDLDFSLVSRILQLPTPLLAREPATKEYVDALVEGLNWKDNVRVRAQGNVDLSAPGATIDGVTMATSGVDRFLAPLQTTGSEIGIYVWNGAAAAATRASDANAASELINAIVIVDGGTDAGTTWRQTVLPITLGTTTLAFSSFGATVPSASTTVAGKAELATQAEVDAGTSTDTIVTPETFAASSKRAKGFETDIGDGSATSYTVTHSLGTKAVLVQVYQNSDGAEVTTDVVRGTINAVTIGVSSAPASNALHVVVAKVPA